MFPDDIFHCIDSFNLLKENLNLFCNTPLFSKAQVQQTINQCTQRGIKQKRITYTGIIFLLRKTKDILIKTLLKLFYERDTSEAPQMFLDDLKEKPKGIFVVFPTKTGALTNLITVVNKLLVLIFQVLCCQILLSRNSSLNLVRLCLQIHKLFV